MKCFIDTEFSDFIDSQLISFGAVTEDGREFYAEITDYDPRACSSFVNAHVIPLLGQPTDILRRLTYVDCGWQLANWIESLEDKIDIIIDYKLDWDFLVDLVDDLWPANLETNPIMIHGDMQRACCIKIAKRDAAITCEGRVFDEAIDGMPLGKALGEYHQIFHDAFLEHFYITQQHQPSYKQHHALFDARANHAGWKAAMSFIESL